MLIIVYNTNVKKKYLTCEKILNYLLFFYVQKVKKYSFFITLWEEIVIWVEKGKKAAKIKRDRAVAKS